MEKLTVLVSAVCKTESQNPLGVRLSEKQTLVSKQGVKLKFGGFTYTNDGRGIHCCTSACQIYLLTGRSWHWSDWTKVTYLYYWLSEVHDAVLHKFTQYGYPPCEHVNSVKGQGLLVISIGHGSPGLSLHHHDMWTSLWWCDNNSPRISSLTASKACATCTTAAATTASC